MKLKQKIPYNIRKSLARVLPWATVLIMASACQKKYDVVIDWDWHDNLGYAPPKEMIKSETDKRCVETVFINLTSDNSTGHTPRNFHNARDSLQTRIDINPNKVRGMGTIYVNSKNGAQLPDPTDWDNCGMALEDSLWFTSNGWKVQRFNPQYTK